MALGKNVNKNQGKADGDYPEENKAQKPEEKSVDHNTDLKNEADLYKTLMNGAIDSIIIIDEKRIIKFFNLAAEELWGYSADEVIGKNVKILMTEMDSSDHDQYVQNYMRTGDAKVMGTRREVTAKRKDGSEFPAMLTLSEAKYQGTRYFSAFMRDITQEVEQRAKMREQDEEIRQQMEELKSSEEEVRQQMEEMQAIQETAEREKQKTTAILDGAVDAVISIDSRNNVEYFNPAAEKLFGYSADQVVGKKMDFLAPPEERENHNAGLDRHLRTGEKRVIGKGREIEIYTSEKDRIPALLTLSDVQLGDEKFFTAFIKDLREQKKLEAQIEAQQKRIEAELGGTLGAVNENFATIEFTPDGNVMKANDLFLKSMGYSMGEIEGKHHELFVHDEYKRSREYQQFWEDLRSGISQTGEVEHISKNGDRVWLNAVYKPIFDENGQVHKVIKIAQNVTDFRVSFEAVKNFTAEISQGNFDAEMKLRGVDVSDDIRGMLDSMLLLRDNLRNIIAEISRVVRAAGQEGRLDERLEIADAEGSWAELTDQVNALLENISMPLNAINEVLQALAAGDLTREVELKTAGDLRKMVDGLSSAIKSIHQLIAQLDDNANIISGASEEMNQKTKSVQQTTKETSTAIQQMANGSQEQAERTDESLKLVEDLMRAAKEMAEQADTINKAAEGGRRNAESGAKAVSSLVQNMEEISSSADETNESISILTNRSEEISKTLSVITDIAFQTKLLALNANIEAARAGEAGRGFAVVAEEISKLAEDSRNSADDIDKVIKDVQKDVGHAAKAIDKMKSSVQSGQMATGEADEIFKYINSSTDETYELSKTISSSMQDQQGGMDTVVKNIERIVVAAEETASGTQQIANSSQELDNTMDDINETAGNLESIARSLKENVNKFKLK